MPQTAIEHLELVNDDDDDDDDLRSESDKTIDAEVCNSFFLYLYR